MQGMTQDVTQDTVEGEVKGATRCVLLLGGSFDPVHCGHVALGSHFSDLLQADQLRVIPAGAPWQKNSLQANGEQRAEMLRLAFAAQTVPVAVDMQEVDRAAPTYPIDTLRQLRSVFGAQASLIFLIGADQLQRLATWREWHQLFDYAHIGVAARPGFALSGPDVPPDVAAEFIWRQGTVEQIRNTPHGKIYVAQDFAADISATQVRAALQRGEAPNTLIPKVVLDYIQQHHLYKS
jgi:nicotinate-nucleotide adenylyltransferase